MYILLAVERDTRGMSIVHTAGGGKGCTRHVHTAGGGKGYTRHDHTAGGGRGYTLHVHTAVVGVILAIGC